MNEWEAELAHAAIKTPVRGWRTLFSTPKGTSSTDVRVLGLKSLAVGLVCFLPGVLWFIATRSWLLAHAGVPDGAGEVSVHVGKGAAFVICGPLVLGYALVMIGLSRIVFGAAADSKSVVVGLARLVFGVVATLALIVGTVMLFALVGQLA